METVQAEDNFVVEKEATLYTATEGDWQYPEDGTYYFEEITGAMAKGTVTIDGKEYTFDEQTGKLQQ